MKFCRATLSLMIAGVCTFAATSACSTGEPAAESVGEAEQNLYFNDDVVSWFDASPSNVIHACWSGFFDWSGVNPPGPHGSCTTDADCPAGDFCNANRCNTPLPGAWTSNTTPANQTKQWARDAINAQWQSNSGLTFVWHDSCPNPIPQSYVPLRIVEVGSLGGIGGYAQYGVGSRVGQDAFVAGTEPDAQIQIGAFTGDPLSERQIKAVAVHEMGHVLSALHEHERPDRMGYCFNPGDDFADLPIIDTGLYVTKPYDHDSIMNYCRDIDDDGRSDGYTEDVSEVLTATDKAGIQAIYGFPGSSTNPTRNFCASYNQHLLIGDANGDGRKDLICNDVAEGELSVDLASATGAFTDTNWTAQVDFCRSATQQAFVLDLNGDGRDDLLCREPSTGFLQAIFATASGSYPEVTWQGPFARWCSRPGDELYVGDFDRAEGQDDLLCLSADGALSVQYSVLPVFPGESCTQANAVDLGAPGNEVTVPNNGCVKVQNGYPSWWGTRTMKLETTTPGLYPAPFVWTNSCSGGSGSGTFTGDWQAQFLGPTSSACATVIDLRGAGVGNVKLRYYAN
jgi:Cys-rich repeat protein